MNQESAQLWTQMIESLISKRSKMWLISLCLLNIWSLYSCDDTLKDELVETEGTERSTATFVARADEWRWPDETAPARAFSGRILFSARPQRGSLYSSTSASTSDSEVPREVKLLLPQSEQLSGTVSIALDSTSIAAPIPVDGWLFSADESGHRETQRDQDPFSSAQLLFNVARRSSDLFGQLSPRPFSLFVAPLNAASSNLPPFVFKGIMTQRFDVTLPPLTELTTLNFEVWRDPDINAALSESELSIWRGDRLLSSFSVTDSFGRGSLVVWSADLNDEDESEEIQIRVDPPESSQLPVLVQRMTLSQLRELSSTGASVTLIYPRLSSLISLPVRISSPEEGGEGEEASDLFLWTLSASQLWSETRERAATSPQPEERYRGSAVWRDSVITSPQSLSALNLYAGGAVVFIQPSAHSPFRTQRLELSDVSEGDTLRVITQDLPLVRGQLRGELNEVMRAQVTFRQLAWPWVDAQHLPLGEYVVDSDAQGSFAIPLEPGVYAMTITPLITGYAPRVVLVDVPEAEGLLLAPQQVTVYQGEETRVYVGSEGSPPQPAGSRVKVSCLISARDAAFQDTSQRLASPQVFKVSLTQGDLSAGETALMWLHESSCPEWNFSER